MKCLICGKTWGNTRKTDIIYKKICSRCRNKTLNCLIGLGLIDIKMFIKKKDSEVEDE